MDGQLFESGVKGSLNAAEVFFISGQVLDRAHI